VPMQTWLALLPLQPLQARESPPAVIGSGVPPEVSGPRGLFFGDGLGGISALREAQLLPRPFAVGAPREFPRDLLNGRERWQVRWYQVPAWTKFGLAPTWINLDSYWSYLDQLRQL